MNLDLDDAQTRALLGLLVEAIEADRYPLSPRVRVLRAILAKTFTGDTENGREPG